jgi:cysteine desulfurase
VIYLDHNATTPLHPEARAAAVRALEIVGNPSSHHAAGRAARRIVDEAREAVARAVGAEPAEIVFTSGGTEAAALGVVGAALAQRDLGRGAHVLAGAAEHACVLESARFLGPLGFEVGIVPVDGAGRVRADAVAAAARADTVLLCVQSANNETGTENDVAALAGALRARAPHALIFCDAVQSLGRRPVALARGGDPENELAFDLFALSAHKVHGPKGAGALVVRRGTPLSPLLRGGGQEALRRAGTENVPGIAGFGAAAALVPELVAVSAARVGPLRDALEARLRAGFPDLLGNGPGAGNPARLPNTLNVSFPGVDGDALRIALDLEGIAISGGPACASGATEPSHVLLALGRTRDEARSAVRFSLGVATTEADIERAASTTLRLALRMRDRAAFRAR